MQTCFLFSRYRTIMFNFSAMLILLLSSSTVFAVGVSQNLQNYKSIEQENIGIGIVAAAKWLFNPSAFKASWPRYGYAYSEIANLCALDSLQRYDIGSGALAIRKDGKYVGFLLTEDTDGSDIGDEIDALKNKEWKSPGSTDNVKESDAIRMGKVCEILENSNIEGILNDQDIHGEILVTRHPIPGGTPELRLVRDRSE